jgi:four helix bundle protein
MTIKKFTDLDAWKEAHRLTLLVYKYTKNFPKDEIYGLRQQLRRAAVSIESCIAEGFARFHYKSRLNFYYDARASIREVQSQTITSYDLRYFTKKKYEEIMEQSEKTAIILAGLIRSTERRSKRKIS